MYMSEISNVTKKNKNIKNMFNRTLQCELWSSLLAATRQQMGAYCKQIFGSWLTTAFEKYVNKRGHGNNQKYKFYIIQGILV